MIVIPPGVCRVSWDTWRHPSYPKPGGRSWRPGTHGGNRAVLSQEVGAGTTGRVAALELPRVGRRELAPRDAWRHPNYPEPRGGGGADTTGRMVAPEPPKARGWELVPWDAW
jgi:hypothetical protein